MANRNKKIIKEQEVATNNVATFPANDVVDIDLSVTEKKRFRIDGDNNRILYLNTSDIGMIARLDEGEKKLVNLETKSREYSELADDENVNNGELSDKFKELDVEMRELLDFIFDANVSEICAPDGSMYDPFEGKPRYEHIIDRLIPLYEQNIAKEARALSVKSKKYTDKYTK